MTHTVDRLFTTPPLPGIKCDWTNIKKPSSLLTHYSLLFTYYVLSKCGHVNRQPYLIKGHNYFRSTIKKEQAFTIIYI